MPATESHADAIIDAAASAVPDCPSRVLLVGVSVRMLAQSAARAGIRASSLDWFADTDTAASSEHCTAVASPDGVDFDRERLIGMADQQAPPGARGSALVYGGGLDSRPELLMALCQGRTLYGNAPETLRTCKSPAHFFGLLDRCGIAHPEICLGPLATGQEPADWLVKQRGSEGGVGVTALGDDGTLPAGAYLQRRLDGKPHSLLFLADGERIASVGFNRLLTTGHRRHQPFLFAGAITPTALSATQCAVVRRQALTLTRALRLVGLNSLDFIAAGDGCSVLEINPRPSATLGLHDRKYPHGLLAAHMAACQGVLTPAGPDPEHPRGFRIAYAEGNLTVPQAFPWPEWAADRPAGGTAIAAGAPICSIAAEAASVGMLERGLFVRERVLRTALML